MGELPQLFGHQVRRIHAVGVGGMGLGPLAIYLAGRGFVISGQDDALGEPMRDQLRRGGVTIENGLPAGVDLLVHSSAIKAEHPAMRAARECDVLVKRRGEVLAEIAGDRRLVVIAGSHGKTSVTAMLITVLRQAPVKFDYVLGGLFADSAWPPAQAGADHDGWLVVEVDESDGTIDCFAPEITTIVNFDWDHTDRYHEAAELETAFVALANRTRSVVLVPDGATWPGKRAPMRFGAEGDFRLNSFQAGPTGLELELGNRFSLPRARIPAWGGFNAVNAVAALATSESMQLPVTERSLQDYPGVHRRQRILAEAAGITVVEDYAHHPVEIAAFLEGVKLRKTEEGRLIVVFQPHRFSRTRQFRDEFVDVLKTADRLLLLDVYGAGESPVEGGTTADLAARLREENPTLAVFYEPGDGDQLDQELSEAVGTGDWVAFVGAGDIEVRARRWAGTLTGRSRWEDLAVHLRNQLSSSARVRAEEPLANKTTIRIGGAARLYVEPVTVADLQTVIRAANERGLPLFMLGRGSNLLVPDEGVDGVVVSLRKAAWEDFEVLDDGRVRVGAGLRLKNLCGLAAKAGLVGFEFLEGIPGNVGGALRMNAGAMGGWMFDVVDQVEGLSWEGEPVSWRHDELHVGYRHCRELERAVAVSAILRPREISASEQVGRQIDVYRLKRQESQPREPSAGCIFKNPEGDSAGRLIDVGGLKGMREGGAQVSEVHGNFIINRGGASCADVIRLVLRVRAEVREKSGIDLQPEVLLFGSKWEDVL